MARIRDQLFPEHRTQFRDYVRIVYQMNECRFIRTFQTQDQTTSGQADVGGIFHSTGPAYDWEDFRSFMTVFRKVGIAKDEPTYFSKVFKLVGQYASDEFRHRLESNRRNVMARLEGYW